MNLATWRDFGPFGDRTWLNCAHQGPLPRRAAEEALEAVDWKRAPFELSQNRFARIPKRLKESLARLIGASTDEIILANSASYGLHLLANGIPWRNGDEVLLVQGDFPSDILPWLALDARGVIVRFINPVNHLPTSQELEAHITPRTRLFCSTWVHSFSGVTADTAALGEVCRANGITFVVNAAQALGARPIDVSGAKVDALVGVGFKWLCGPYGTGFCWMRPPLLQSLEYNQAYWLAEMTAEELGREKMKLHRPKGPRRAADFDVFGTANFFNFKPWSAAIEYLLEQGIERVAEHDQHLVSRLIGSLDTDRYRLLSPREGPERSTLVFVSHRNPERNREISEHLERVGIDVALRRGRLRFSPHLYNTEEDIDKALAALHAK